MARDKKTIEKARQAKTMRQKARANERKREAVAPSGAPRDDFDMFRRSLAPNDLHPSIWNRRQILHDLDGHRPAEALRQFFSQFLDDETLERGGPQADQQMDWGLYVWRLSVTDPRERDTRIDEGSERLPDDEAKRAKFRADVRTLIAIHEEMFPTLHATLARFRGLADTPAPNGAAAPQFDIELQMAETPSAASPDPMMEFARPLLEAAGSDPNAMARALVTASDLWSAAQAPVEKRVAILRSLRARLPVEEQADFDEISRMMLKRYRDMFAPGAAKEPRPTTHDNEFRPTADDPQPRVDEPQPEADADASEEQPSSLLGRWLRRRR